MQAGTIDFAQSMGKRIDGVREHLSLVYHRYLTGEPGLEKIRIAINNCEVIPADPFLIKKSDQTMQEEVYIIRGAKITVQPYILPHMSKMTASEIKASGGKDGLRKNQGFYVYRNRRLLIWGTWFRMMRKGELSKLARIRVDIPNTLDDLWTLDIKKSSAMPPEEVKNNLISVINKIGEKSKNKFTYRGKLETNDNEIHLWNRIKARDGGYYYEVNRQHPIVIQLMAVLNTNQNMLNSLLTQIERALPLNQLYIDLNGDEHISNDQTQQNDEIESALRQMLPNTLSKKQKLEFLDQIAVIPPYLSYPLVISKVKEEVEANG